MATTKCPVGTMVKLIRYPDSELSEEFVGKVISIIDDPDEIFHGYAIWESKTVSNRMLHCATSYVEHGLNKYYYINDEMFETEKWNAICEPIYPSAINIEELI